MPRGQAQHPWSSADVELVEAGNLVLTTGSIIGCDPLVSLDDRQPFTRPVAPGTYRVVIALRDGDVLYASVVLGEGTPQRWVPGLCAGELEPEGDDRVPGYGVDAGTGCFVDAATAAVWNAATSGWLTEKVQRVAAMGVDANDATAWHAALRTFDGERPELDLMARFEAGGFRRRPCVEIAIEGAGTLVAFQSGAGDGVYPSYWGLDDRGNALVLLTDFGLLGPEEDEDEDEEEHEPAHQPGPEPGEPALVRLGTALLDRLLRDELLVLTRPTKRTALRDDLADILAAIADDGSRGAALAQWLSDRNDVEEVFASDDDLERVLRETIQLVR